MFAAGDAAAVPDLTSPDPGATTAPTAQHAVRQAKVLADNILAHLVGTAPRDYAHTHTGAVATLGRHRGVADIYGHPLTGWPAWVLHRAYHLAAMPTWDRRARIAADWLLNAMFDRDTVTLSPAVPPGGLEEDTMTASTHHSRALPPAPSAPSAPSQPPHPPGRAAPCGTDQTTTGPAAPVRNAPGALTAGPDTGPPRTHPIPRRTPRPSPGAHPQNPSPPPHDRHPEGPTEYAHRARDSTRSEPRARPELAQSGPAGQAPGPRSGG